MKKNSLLISQLTASGNYVLFGTDDVKVYQHLKVIGPPTMQGRRLESMGLLLAQEAYIDKARKSETANLWHTRLGHVSYHNLKIMMSIQVSADLLNLSLANRSTIKAYLNGSVERYRARLIALGLSQKYRLDYDKMFSPMAKLTIV